MLWLLRILVILFPLVTIQTAYSADTLYVKQGADSAGDGLSWATAFGSLYTALDAWEQGDEIWVARGTYAVDITQAYIVENKMRIYGGFKGTEILREHRDWYRFPVILTADVLRNDGDAINATDPRRVDNSTFVLEFENSSIDSSTILDGLQFSGANGIVSDGNAVIVPGGSPVFRNCKFFSNVTNDLGAAVRIAGAGRPRFEYCVFSGNGARNGGAVHIAGPIDSLVRGPYFGECVWEDNVASENGAGIFMADRARMDIVSCVFYRNVAAGGGGAIYGSPFSYPVIYNSTFMRNEGGPERGWTFEARGADVVSSIFWHGADPIGSLIKRPSGVGEDTAAIQTRQCLVQNDFVYGFYQNDPEFIDEENPVGADGFWGTDDDGLRVELSSICRDKGLVTPTTNFMRVDAIGNPRVVGNKPDIGAYEWQREGHDDYVAIMSEIRTGKLVLLYRHGITDWSSQDPGPSPECAGARNLSEDGRDQTKSVGKYIRALNVPLEDVFTSPVCRCWESALYMAGRYDKKSHWASGGGAVSDSLRHIDLSSIPINGCRMINTHDAVIVPAIEASSAEIEEGDNAVLRPDGTDFLWISHFTSDNWERYRVRFPDASVGVEYESVTEKQALAPLHKLLYTANSIVVYNVLGTQLLSAAGDVAALRSAINELASGWYAVVVTDVDGTTRAATLLHELLR